MIFCHNLYPAKILLLLAKNKGNVGTTISPIEGLFLLSFTTFHNPRILMPFMKLQPDKNPVNHVRMLIYFSDSNSPVSN